MFMTLFKTVDLEFAEKLTLNLSFRNEKSYIEITDPDDFVKFKQLCEGRATDDSTIPSCSFGAVELLFENNDKQFFLYPASDTCKIMRFGKEDKYFYGNFSHALCPRHISRYSKY